MSLPFAVDLLLGLPLAVILTIAAIRRVIQRLSPLAHLAVITLLLTGVDWFSGDWQATPPFWVGGVTVLAWLVLFLAYPDGIVRPRWGLWLLGSFVAIDIWITATGKVDPVLLPLLLVVVAAGLGCQLWRYGRRANVSERQAVRWALLGIMPFLAYCLGFGIVSSLPWNPDLAANEPLLAAGDVAIMWVVPWTAAAGLLVPASWGVDKLLRVVCVVSGTGFVLGLGYALLFPFLSQGWAAALMAALVWPIGWLFQRPAAFLVYGKSGRPALSALSSSLEGSLGPEDVAHTVAATVVVELVVPYAAVASTGTLVSAGLLPCGGFIEEFPVTYQGSRVATLLVSCRRGESTLLPRDRALLTSLARDAGPALHGAATVTELRSARETLVLAREGERRRLRRDLHDDLAPTLSGLGFKAAAVAAMQITDPPRAASLSLDLEAGIRNAAAQVRDIAYDLRPPILDDRGLVAAIRERISIDASSPMSVVVEAKPAQMTLPAAVELAALRIVQEAVNNVRRHAAASRCVVQLELAAGHLGIHILDDGVGLAPGTGRGMGLASIRGRSQELGGTVRITSSSEGTRVHVSLPVQDMTGELR